MASQSSEPEMTPREWALWRKEMLDWFHRMPDEHLEWAAGMNQNNARPWQSHVENAEMAARILAWRRLGVEGPFR